MKLSSKNLAAKRPVVYYKCHNHGWDQINKRIDLTILNSVDRYLSSPHSGIFAQIRLDVKSRIRGMNTV